MEIGRRELLTGLVAFAAVGVVPVLPAAAAPAGPTIHRLFLYDDDEAIRWQFSEVISDPFYAYSIEQLIPSSLWDFDAHLNFDSDKRLFSLRHVASGITFRQIHPHTAAFRFDYWDMAAAERPTWVDTTDIAIVGDGAVCALAGILRRPTLIDQSPLRVRFSPEPFSYRETPVVAEAKAAPPLDYYAHVED
jgi:hypothetical protein